jgi:hypothetical protein
MGPTPECHCEAAQRLMAPWRVCPWHRSAHSLEPYRRGEPGRIREHRRWRCGRGDWRSTPGRSTTTLGWAAFAPLGIPGIERCSTILTFPRYSCFPLNGISCQCRNPLQKWNTRENYRSSARRHKAGETLHPDCYPTAIHLPPRTQMTRRWTLEAARIRRFFNVSSDGKGTIFAALEPEWATATLAPLDFAPLLLRRRSIIPSNL